MARHKQLRERRGAGRFAVIAVSAVALAGTALAGGATASAAGILPTTTTAVTSSPWVAVGSPVNVTATVKILGLLNGLAVTPTGTVTFKTNTTSVTGTLGFCLLTACTATASLGGFHAGANTVTATYNGDLLSAASNGTKQVTGYAPSPGASSSDSESCPASEITCSADAETGVDCNADVPTVCTTLDVTDVNSATARTVNAALITGNPPSCADDPADPTQPWALFSSTSPTASKLVNMRIDGAAADALVPPLDGSGNPIYNWFGCYTSTKAFNGYVGGGSNHVAGTFGPAPLVGGFYQAKLPRCDGSPLFNPDSQSLEGLNPGSPVPCVSLDYRQSSFFGDELTVTIQTAPGDPKYVPN